MAPRWPRARLSDDLKRLTDVKVIFRQQPKMASRNHFGCRIAEVPDGKLVLSLGERFSGMQSAQTLDNHLGKLVRIGKDGSVPADNPFVNTAGALPEIWSYGHRNSQGLTLDDKGQLWEHEHGPQGGDELNLIAPKLNYGWPVITYGENYGGGKIGDGPLRQGRHGAARRQVGALHRALGTGAPEERQVRPRLAGQLLHRLAEVRLPRAGAAGCGQPARRAGEAVRGHRADEGCARRAGRACCTWCWKGMAAS